MNDFSASQKQGLHGYGDLLDLTSHQRNLLLIRPLLKLDFNKLMHTQEDGSYLLEGIDTNYLCLAALYFMMEGAAIQQGYMLGEVREHLKMIAGSMKHTLDEDSRGRIADIVLDALSNKSNKYVEHRESYFHAPSGETRVLNFRLIRFEADFEENYRYSPTREGYLVLSHLRVDTQAKAKRGGGGPLLLDNPFANVQTRALIDAQRMLAKSLKIQLICLTANADPNIIEGFRRVLRLRKAGMQKYSGRTYIEMAKATFADGAVPA